MTTTRHEHQAQVANPKDDSVLESDHLLRQWTRGIFYASNVEDAMLHVRSLVQEELRVALESDKAWERKHKEFDDWHEELCDECKKVYAEDLCEDCPH